MNQLGRDRKGVLFVCMGNICRSPLAEGIFLHLASERGVRDRFLVDSAGTGAWHTGEPADPRSIAVALARGVHLPSIARQVDPESDFERFDLILAMDRSNRTGLLNLGAPSERVRLMRSFDSTLRGAPEDELDVPDPYYGRGDGFVRVYDMLHRATTGLLDELMRGE
ncbi:MAG: low molecular weight phosphotyrosine protein phosphatase [Phycisphaeraceae bacterium]|nr:low molecular weight phosphotyrosine protein phosphatase [Phycisphaeraceae bacterium]